MANTFTLIASTTVGSGGAANITFSSIPSTYTDLLVKWSARSVKSAAQESVYINFNGSTSNFSSKWLYGDGSGAYSLSTSTVESAGFCVAGTMTANTFTSADCYIPNYAGSNNKSFSIDSVDEGNQTTVYSELIAGLWSNTAAINSIKIYPAANNFAQYTTAYIYGIKNS